MKISGREGNLSAAWIVLLSTRLTPSAGGVKLADRRCRTALTGERKGQHVEAQIAGGGGMLSKMPTPMVHLAKNSASLGEFAKQAASSAAGGGYSFSPEEIDAVLSQWEQLRDDLQNDVDEANKIAGVQAPGNEPASNTFVGSANPAGQALLQQTMSMLKHTQQYIEALKKAKGVTEAADEQAAEDAGKAGNGVLG